jgi:murein DD-endopeptidase MepM/ murein hydrolase activator NlpD
MIRTIYIYYLLNLIFIHRNESLAIGFSNADTSSYSTFILADKDSLNARKKWVTNPYISHIKSDSISFELRNSNIIFTEKWINDVLFVYEDVKYADLPDNIELSLLTPNENFYFNWYGQLYSGYGPRWGKIHRGLDLYLITGDSVVSSFDGIVRYARFNEGGYGNCVIVRHLNGLETLHGHLSKISVKENQFVKAGNLLGLGGSTGRSDGPHLHFETRYKDFSFDPYLIINKETNTLLNDTSLIYKSDILYYRYPSEAPFVKKKGKSKKAKGKKKSYKKNNKSKKSSSNRKKNVNTSQAKKSTSNKGKLTVKGKATTKSKKSKTKPKKSKTKK